MKCQVRPIFMGCTWGEDFYDPCIIWGMALLRQLAGELLFCYCYYQFLELTDTILQRRHFTHVLWEKYFETFWQQQLLISTKGPYLITDQFDIVWRTFKDCFCARITITNTIIKCFYQDKGFKKALTIFLMNSRQEHNEILGYNVLK